MLPEKEPTLDVTKTHLAELISAFKPEDDNFIYLTFVTCDQPQPVYIYGSCLPGPQPLGVPNELLESEYPIGSRFNLTVGATVMDGKTRYYTDDIIPKISI